MSDQRHVYDRCLETEGRSSLAVIAARVPRMAKVLDIGCGTGALGRRLAQTHACAVDGVTFNPREAALAAAHCRHVGVLDLEQAVLADALRGARYDVIVCADILEHLRAPGRLLDQLPALLADGGRLLVSVPNTGYAGIVAELMQGDYLYRPEGLLDDTHVRLYTRRSLLRQLREHGFAPTAVETIERELCYSEFEPTLAGLPPAVRSYVLGRPDAFVYQFIVEATPATVGRRQEPTALDTGETGRPYFTTAIGMLVDQDYAEATRCFARGLIGEARQTVRFALPALDRPARRLRCEPAHRPGVMQLWAVRLVKGQDTVVWRWDGLLESLASVVRTNMKFAAAQDRPGELTMMLEDDDPSFELPIPPEMLDKAFDGQHRIAIELGWPVSADYQLLPPLLAAELEASRTALAERTRERDSLRAELDALVSGRAFRLARRLSRIKRRLTGR
ncbi:MAG: class I SAM-dependent methyltransferase [Rhodocyclaceae bacterium]|nr:class I SAM-dependent methyltransferase [Rhodocyclaceae bacterium]